MKLVTIFQQRNPSFREGQPTDDMVKVASFHTDLDTAEALDEAFRLTNVWDDLARLKMEPVEYGSTSIGDVVTVDNEAYQCARSGWVRLDGWRHAR